MLIAVCLHLSPLQSNDHYAKKCSLVECQRGPVKGPGLLAGVGNSSLAAAMQRRRVVAAIKESRGDSTHTEGVLCLCQESTCVAKSVCCYSDHLMHPPSHTRRTTHFKTFVFLTFQLECEVCHGGTDVKGFLQVDKSEQSQPACCVGDLFHRGQGLLQPLLPCPALQPGGGLFCTGPQALLLAWKCS